MDKTYTKSELIKEFANDAIELDEHIKYEAKEVGKTVKEFAKELAKLEFDIHLESGEIVKVGRRYKFK